MVEDDVLVSSVVVSALEASGYHESLCGSADEALALLERADGFDVLFTDVVMPGKMTGMDLAHWCQTHRPALAVVVATGYTTQRVDGPFQVLKKPYQLSTLQEALRTSVSSEDARLA